jgi:malate dehydrogenase
MGRKVGIVGAGAVGASAAYALAMKGTCDEIVLFDIFPEVAIGKGIDIAQASSFAPSPTKVYGVKEAKDLKDCDIVVVTAGVPRKSDMTRADLLNVNAKIVKDVTSNIMKYSPNAIIICVSNPLDVMTYVMHKLTNWNRSRIVGMAGVLDGARMRYQITQKLGFGAGVTRTMVIGEHGQKMIAYVDASSVGGVALKELLDEKDLEDIAIKTRDGGAEIVSHLKTSAYYAPGSSIAYMVEAILDDSKAVMSACCLLDGEYGYKDQTLGVPVVLGRDGVEKIIEMDMDDKNKALLKEAADSIKENIEILKNEGFFNS